MIEDQETLEGIFTARRVCRFCQEVFKIKVEVCPGTIEEIVKSIGYDISDDLIARGWRDGACPDCVHIHHETLKEEYYSDGEPAEEWEGGEYV